MPRINSSEQYRRHYVLKIIWRDHPKLYGTLPAHQQWRLHRYYQPTVELSQVELDEHRRQVTIQQPSLPQAAGKSFRQIERLYLLAVSLSQRTGAPIEVCLNAVIQHVVLKHAKVMQPTTGRTVRGGVYVVATARPEPDIKLFARALLILVDQHSDHSDHGEAGV